jgi:hypothetical protein
MCTQGAMFDARSAMLVTGWPERKLRDAHRSLDPMEPAFLDYGPALTPPGPLEQLITDVPLSPDERELWADLLDEKSLRPGRRSGLRRSRHRSSSGETTPTF